MPVWTSSNTSAAPAASHAARIDGQQLRSRRRSRPTRPGSARSAPRPSARPTAAGISVGVDRAEARDQRRERRLLGLLRRRATARRTCARGTRSWATIDVAARAELAHELDRRLVGLRAGVAEEHDLAERPRRQPRGQRDVRRRCRTGSRRASAAPTCSCTRRHDRRVAVAEVVDRDPARGSRGTRSPSASTSTQPRAGRRTRPGSARRWAPGVMTRASPSCRCRRP